MLVLGFPEYLPQARALATALDASFDVIHLHRFPDGESKLQLPATLPDHVVLYRSLDRPNEKLVELMLAAEAARTLGAGKLTLVAPYLCYMRQDIAFHPGEAVSQQIIGRFLASLIDRLITVDPHLHRVRTLVEAVPTNQAVALSAAPAMGAFLAARASRPLLVGPDEESEQWVKTAAAAATLDYVVAHKTRRGDHTVEVRLPDHDYQGVEAILVDDVASTGHTLAATAKALRAAGVAHVDVLVTHALFVDDALDMLQEAGVTHVWSSDSVVHRSNTIALAPIISEAIEKDVHRD